MTSQMLEHYLPYSYIMRMLVLDIKKGFLKVIKTTLKSLPYVEKCLPKKIKQSSWEGMSSLSYENSFRLITIWLYIY